MTEEQAEYAARDVPDGYLEDLRKRIEQADRDLEKLQDEYGHLTGQRYKWFR